MLGPTPTAAQGRERFRAWLNAHNLPVTAPRLAVAEVALGSDAHMAAAEIERALDAGDTPASTATIYRTLELLVRSGLLVERDFGEGFKRYEAARGIPHHEHLLCTVCGTVQEFRDERLERMTTLIAEAHGFARAEHRLVIRGVCDGCRSR